MPLNYSTGVVPSRWCLPKVLAQFEEYGRCLVLDHAQRPTLADTIMRTPAFGARIAELPNLGKKYYQCIPPFTKISIIPIGRPPRVVGMRWNLVLPSLGIFLDYPQITPDRASNDLEFHLAAYRLMSNLRLHP